MAGECSRVLHGAEAFAEQGWIADGLTPDAIHDRLLKIALWGNSARPVAARVQSHPARIARLLGECHPTTFQARTGGAYNLAQRPFQCHRPHVIRLKTGGLHDAAAEIERLELVCGAVESAPAHDRDKAPGCVGLGASPPPEETVAGGETHTAGFVPGGEATL